MVFSSSVSGLQTADLLFELRATFRLSECGFLASGSLKFDYPVLPSIDHGGCYPATTTTTTTTGATYLNDSLPSGSETGG
jgi:hypothetical protein